MACKLQPMVTPSRVVLEGTFILKNSPTPRIIIEADISNLTTLLKDEELSTYIRAICSITIDDTESTTMRGTQSEDADIYSNTVSFDINLSETMSFSWWDSHTDIWCETYILVDTVQMSEDYNITISDDYKDMKGEVVKTYIIVDGKTNVDLAIVDSREVNEALETSSNPATVGQVLETCDVEPTDVNTPGDYKKAPKITTTFGSLNKIEREDNTGLDTFVSNTKGEKA
jgi:hypothetical protein